MAGEGGWDEAGAAGFGEKRLKNTLPLYGNKDSMNINSMILTNILGSPYFKEELIAYKTFHEVVDEIYYKVDHLEPWEKNSRKLAGQVGMCAGVRGVAAGGIVSTAYCLLFKLFTFKLTRKQVTAMMNHRDSPYIRGIGFMYVRYCQPPADFWDWFSPYLDDEEEVDLKAGGGCSVSIGEMCSMMISKLDWFGTLFPRLPVNMQKNLEAKLKEFKMATRLEQDSENQVNGVAAGRSDSAPGADEWGEAGRRAEEESRENRLRERRSPPNRDRSIDRRRSRSRERWRSRANSRERRRSRSRERRRSMSRSRDKQRPRSMEKRRSRSVEKRRRSRSLEKRRSRSRSADKRRRSRSVEKRRSRSRSIQKLSRSIEKRKRSRSIDKRKRSRSHSVVKHRSRSRSIEKRSRSIEKRKRSRSIDKRKRSRSHSAGKRKRSRSVEKCKKSRSHSTEKTDRRKSRSRSRDRGHRVHRSRGSRERRSRSKDRRKSHSRERRGAEHSSRRRSHSRERRR